MAKESKKCCYCKKVLPLSDFGNAEATYDGKQTACKICSLAYKRKVSKTEKGKQLNRKHNLKSSFGITPQQYNEMLKQQEGSCAICDGINKNGKRLAVDHDHETGEIRGLLCNKCNSVLGWAGDNIAVLAGAIKYLKEAEDS